MKKIELNGFDKYNGYINNIIKEAKRQSLFNKDKYVTYNGKNFLHCVTGGLNVYCDNHQQEVFISQSELFKPKGVYEYEVYMHRILNYRDGVSICELKCLKHIISEVFCIQYVKDDNKSLLDRTYLSLGNSECIIDFPITQLQRNCNYQVYPNGLNPNLNEVLKVAMDASSSDYKGQYELAMIFMNKFDSLVKEIEENVTER